MWFKYLKIRFCNKELQIDKNQMILVFFYLNFTKHNLVYMIADNKEFNRVIDLINNGEKVIFLSGKAGTGKSTFLKNIGNYTSKQLVKIAPTGIAAHNIGATTIHSFFQIRPSVYVPDDKRLRTKADKDDTDPSTIYDHFKFFKERVEVFEKMELLIIDEISMVRCDTIDVIDKVLRVFRKSENLPFGGVQVLMVGDLFQLPPIVSYSESSIINTFYSGKYFFDAKVFGSAPIKLVELEKVYRQQGDAEFLSLLNKIRNNSISQQEIDQLNQKYNPTFNASMEKGFITICTHNDSAKLVNLTQLNQLKNPSFTFRAQISGKYDPRDYPAEFDLELKVGAQIMLIKNNNLKGYYNGQMGTVTEIKNDQIIIQTGNNQQLSVEFEIWKNVSYKWNAQTKKVEEFEIGSFSQYPLRLAWAITVHKSQGLTFDKVFADLGNAFDTGMVYVALSRSTSAKNLILKSMIDSSSISVDSAIINFLESYKNKPTSKSAMVELLIIKSAVNKNGVHWALIVKDEGDIYVKAFVSNFKAQKVGDMIRLPRVIADICKWTDCTFEDLIEIANIEVKNGNANQSLKSLEYAIKECGDVKNSKKIIEALQNARTLIEDKYRKIELNVKREFKTLEELMNA